jgi:hypothetical protein
VAGAVAVVKLGAAVSAVRMQSARAEPLFGQGG